MHVTWQSHTFLRWSSLPQSALPPAGKGASGGLGEGDGSEPGSGGEGEGEGGEGGGGGGGGGARRSRHAAAGATREAVRCALARRTAAGA